MAAEFGLPKRRESTRVSSGLGSLYGIFPQAIQEPVQLVGRDLVIEIVIDLERRRPRTCPNAFHLFERELPVSGHFLVPDPQLRAGPLPQPVPIVEQATD